MKSGIMNRVMREIRTIQESTELWIDFDEKDVRTFKIMFFGPPDSVYHHGIFMFQVTIPENYPFEPPAVLFLTGGIIDGRIHPNLYKEGKVCLSILNTWGGKEWSPLLTLEKIFITIRALLDNNPICYEPSYEGMSLQTTKSKSYAINATYYNLKSIYMFYSEPSLFGGFTPIISDYLTENKQTVLTFVDEFLQKIESYTQSTQSLQTFHHNGTISIPLLTKLRKYIMKEEKE